MIKKPTIIWLVILIVGIGLIVFSSVSRDTRRVSDGPALTESPLSSGTPQPSKQPLITASPAASYPNIVNKYPPAECALSGSIEYVSPGLYENKGAKISYKNVDSIARHIIWSVSPKDDLSVGPNLFAHLPVPDGSEDLSVGLPDNPIAKNYILTAQITYGMFVKGNQEIRNASCSGRIPVKLNY